MKILDAKRGKILYVRDPYGYLVSQYLRDRLQISLRNHEKT